MHEIASGIDREGLTAVVLAGGSSRRMGTDKAGLMIDGLSFLEHVVAAVRESGIDVIVVGRAREDQVGNVDMWIEDEAPDSGPLAALAIGLRNARREVLLLACDMPMIDRRAVEWLATLDHGTQVDATPGDATPGNAAPGNAAPGDATLADATPVDVIVVRQGLRIEPFFARYATSCLPIAERCLEKGERSMMALIDAATCRVVEPPSWVHQRLVNINTPDDLDELRSRPLPRLS